MQSPTIPEIRKETERTVIRFRALLLWITTEPSLDTDQDVGDRTATRISDSCSHAANAMAVFTMVSNPMGVLVDIVYPSISGLGLWHVTDGYWSVTLLGWSCPRVAEGTLWSLGAACCAALRPERSINDPWASAQSDSGMTLRPDAIRMVHSGSPSRALRDAASGTLDRDPPHTRRQLSERRGTLGSDERSAYRRRAHTEHGGDMRVALTLRRAAPVRSGPMTVGRPPTLP